MHRTPQSHSQHGPGCPLGSSSALTTTSSVSALKQQEFLGQDVPSPWRAVPWSAQAENTAGSRGFTGGLAEAPPAHVPSAALSRAQWSCTRPADGDPCSLPTLGFLRAEQSSRTPPRSSCLWGAECLGRHPASGGRGGREVEPEDSVPAASLEGSGEVPEQSPRISF